MSKEKQNLKFNRIVGVKFLKEDEMPKDFDIVKKPGVRSFCDALRLIDTERFSEGLIVTKNTIKICHWSPVALGLKDAETEVQKKIVPLFDELHSGIFIFNISKTSENHPLQSFIDNPDTVILIGSFKVVSKAIEQIGIENFSNEYVKQLEFSALSLFTNFDSLTKKEKRKIKRHLRSTKFINALFASKLISNKPMVKFITKLLTKYPFVKVMDGVLRKTATALSCCYVSTSIPYAKQKATVALIDTGSIGWGEMSKKSVFMGIPYNLYSSIEPEMSLV
jgi:hypothetical protein